MNHLSSSAENIDFLARLVDLAKKSGADAAEAIMCSSAGSSVSFRMGKPEKTESATSETIGLRVLIGKRQAAVSASGIAAKDTDKLIERAISVARKVPEDKYCGLAEPAQICHNPPIINLCDDYQPSLTELAELAKRTEDAALSEKFITNSEGAEASFSKAQFALAASNGFSYSFTRTGAAVAVAVVAEDGKGSRESDHDSSSAVFFADLKSPEEIGKKAAERTASLLGSRKPQSGVMPIVFEPRMAKSLLSHFSSAANGSAIARDASFLKGKLGEQIFANSITIIDDPLLPKGLRSAPIDAEGLCCNKMDMVKDGQLLSWFLDLYAARQLGLNPTGHASSSPGGTPYPTPSNLYFMAGKRSPKELIADIKEGLYITSLSGQGVNIASGNYSRGAQGFAIRDGQIAEPLSEITISGNLAEMFMQMEVANDLEFRYGFNSPSLRIAQMTVAGK